MRGETCVSRVEQVTSFLIESVCQVQPCITIILHSRRLPSKFLSSFMFHVVYSSQTKPFLLLFSCEHKTRENIIKPLTTKRCFVCWSDCCCCCLISEHYRRKRVQCVHRVKGEWWGLVITSTVTREPPVAEQSSLTTDLSRLSCVPDTGERTCPPQPGHSDQRSISQFKPRDLLWRHCALTLHSLLTPGSIVT